jgi:hypothetical protein
MSPICPFEVIDMSIHIEAIGENATPDRYKNISIGGLLMTGKEEHVVIPSNVSIVIPREFDLRYIQTRTGEISFNSLNSLLTLAEGMYFSDGISIGIHRVASPQIGVSDKACSLMLAHFMATHKKNTVFVQGDHQSQVFENGIPTDAPQTLPKEARVYHAHI